MKPGSELRWPVLEPPALPPTLQHTGQVPGAAAGHSSLPSPTLAHNPCLSNSLKTAAHYGPVRWARRQSRGPSPREGATSLRSLPGSQEYKQHFVIDGL
jgi:hypothetical protein